MDNLQKEFVCIRIIGNNIDFNELFKLLPLKFKTRKKGEHVFGQYAAETDVAVYDFDFDEGDLIPQMQKMINILNEHKLNLKKITDKHDVIMRIYVQSNLAQMYFYLPAEIINKLSELSLSLEVSVLSDGEVL